jgi:hypothetical protein
MAFNPYGSVLDFSIEDWSLDSELQSSNGKERGDKGNVVPKDEQPTSPELPFSLEIGENERGNAPSDDLPKGPNFKPIQSNRSEPETTVTAALTEPHESFSFEINLPPGVDVSPLSCKESVMAMMLDRALGAPPPLEEVCTPPSGKKSPRTSSQSRARSKSRPRGSSQAPSSRRRGRKTYDGKFHSGAGSQVNDEREGRSHSKERSGCRRASSKERSSGPSFRLRSKSSDLATVSRRNQSSDGDDRRRRKIRSKSSASKGEDRRRRSPLRQRVSIMGPIPEDKGHSSPKQRRSPSKSRARHRSTSRAPSHQGSKRDATSSGRTRSKSRPGEHRHGSEEIKLRTSLSDNYLPVVQEGGGLPSFEEGTQLPTPRDNAEDEIRRISLTLPKPASPSRRHGEEGRGPGMFDSGPTNATEQIGNKQTARIHAPSRDANPALASPPTDR